MHVLKILHCKYCMYTCGFRINAKLLKEGSFKVIYHPLYGMNKFVTNKSKLLQDGAQVFPYMGDWLSCDPLRGSHDSQSPPYMG